MSNKAAFLDALNSPLRVADAPIGPLRAGELIVKTYYAGIAPLEDIQIKYGFEIARFPAIIGSELSGIVEQVGPGVTGFRVGDRVAARALNLVSQDPQDASYQLYSRVFARATTHVPASISLDVAAGLPLAHTTASYALFGEDFLALERPKVGNAGDHAGEVVYIQAGSGSVGAQAIQLATRAGYRVITTSRTTEMVKRLGAAAIIDYSTGDVAAQLTDAIKSLGKLRGVFLTNASQNDFNVLAQVFKAIDAPANLAVASTLPPPPDGEKYPFKTNVVVAAQMLWKKEDIPLGEYMMRYLGEALAAGELVPAPPVEVVGESLDEVQKGIDIFRSSKTSATKYVVKIAVDCYDDLAVAAYDAHCLL